MAQLLFNNRNPEFHSLDFREVVLDAARNADLEHYILIVPTYRRIRELEREITTEFFRTVGRPLEGLPLYTLDSFAREFYEHLTPARREASPEIQLALMELAMNQVDLDFYGRGERGPSAGVVEAVTRVLNGVRADGIMPSDFARDIAYYHENEESDDVAKYDIAKLGDLYNIYSRYLQLLNAYWVDYPGRMLQVNNTLFQDRDLTFRKAFPGARRLLMHGFTELTQPEIVMLQQLGMVNNLDCLILFDYAQENGPLYGNFDEMISKLVTGGYGLLDLDPLALDVPEEERRPFHHHMRRNLFRTDERIMNSSFDHMMNVYGFFNREEEVRGVAGLVKWMVVEQNIEPEQICIATYNLENYAGLFREHLPGYGIPANITAQFRLEQNALITALFSALHILAGHFDRRDVLRAVTSPYLDFGPDVDPAALAEAATRLRVSRGLQSWLRRIGRRVDYLRFRRERSADADERRNIDLELETLTGADWSIRAVADCLEEFNRRMSPAEFRAAFLKLIAKLKVTENVLLLRHDLESRKRTPQDWQRVHDELERDTRALAEFLKLLDELTEFFEVEYGPDAEEGSDGTHPLDFYLEHFRVASARARYRIREKHDYGVLVTTTEQIQEMDFDVVILCGMIDGEFPSTYIPENFLGKPLPETEQRKLRRERVEFYRTITRFRQRLVMTYPRFADERELVRSSFLDAFLRITTIEESGRVIELNELRPTRERLRQEPTMPPHLEFLAAISTPEELAEEVGRALWQDRSVPRIDAAEEMLENLQAVVMVEKGRYAAKFQGDRESTPEHLGVITPGLSSEERSELEQRREREYSISQLELYGRCPFKYFAQRILNVTVAADYDVTLTPLERGAMLHTVLFRLYTELREQGMLPLSPDDRDRILERAREIAEDEIAGIVLDHPYWSIDQERLLGGEEFGGLLEEWIDADLERRESGKSALEPEFFEAGFGSGALRGGGSDPELSTDADMEVYDIRLRGKVDRVEIYRSGEEILFLIADYKTGQPPTRRDIDDGLSLQLTIYMEVIRHLLAGYFNVPLRNVKPVGGVYYRLDPRRMETQEKYMLVPNELKFSKTTEGLIYARKNAQDPATTEELEEMIGEAFAHADAYVSGIASGSYHVTTYDVNRICRGCDYRSVCRVTEVKGER